MKRLFLLALITMLTGCVAGLGFNTDTPKFQQVYDNAKTKLDQMAMSNQITWIEAATRLREVDKKLAANTTGYDTSWKYDSDDEEYHSFSIAVAEKVDKKQVTFAQYDAARTAKLNQISARRQQINIQVRSLQIQQNSSNKSFNCISTRTGGTVITNCD